MNIGEEQKNSKHFIPSNSGAGFLIAFVLQFAIALILANFIASENFWVKMLIVFLSEMAFLGTFLIMCATTKANKKIAPMFKQKTNYKFYLLSFAIVLIVIACMLMFNNVFLDLIGKIGYSTNSSSYSTNWWQLLVSIFFLAIVPAICEEIVFRGIIYSGLKRYGVILAVVLSSFMFMFFHGGLDQTFFQFALGSILAIALLFTNDIKLCISMHFLNNLTVLLLDYFKIGSAYTLKAWYVAVACILFVIGVGAIVAYGFLMKREAKKQKLDFTIPKEEVVEDGKMLISIAFAVGALYFIYAVVIGFIG